MITGFRRVVKAGFVGFWRNSDVSLTSVYVITIALFVIGCSIFLDQVLERTLDQVQEKVDINLYFVPDAPQDEIDRILVSVEALPDVTNVEYTSREEALRLYRERNQDDEIAMQALAELGENPLGANLAIQAQEISQYEQIARFLDEQKAAEAPQVPVIEEINYERNRVSIETLTAFIEGIENASLIVMGVLMSAAILITFNTIRLVIYTSREEISVMRLVGAGNMYIRGPFMLQGVMYGFISGIVTMAIFYPALIWMGPRLEGYLNFNLYEYYLTNFGPLFGILTGIGVVLGLVSSILAITRYLRT